MRPWHIAITDRYIITHPQIGRINIWAKTKSGKKSRSTCGWDIRDGLLKIPECQCLFSDKTINIGVYKDHLEIY